MSEANELCRLCGNEQAIQSRRFERRPGRLGLACSAFGLFHAVVAAAVILWDLWLFATHRPTVSRWCLEYARNHAWFAVVACVVLLTPAMTLVLHLFEPASGDGPTHGTVVGFLTAMALALGLNAWVFAQSGR